MILQIPSQVHEKFCLWKSFKGLLEVGRHEIAYNAYKKEIVV